MVSYASLILTPSPCICRLRWFSASKISAMYAKMRMNSEFVKQCEWQCWYSRKNRVKSTRMAKTRISTFPRDKHRTLEWYRSTPNSDPISLHSSLKTRCFISQFLILLPVLEVKVLLPWCVVHRISPALQTQSVVPAWLELRPNKLQKPYSTKDSCFWRSHPRVSSHRLGCCCKRVTKNNIPLSRRLYIAHEYNKLA